MRIIGGTRRGHKLAAPKGMATRPTQDRVREAIFNTLANIGLLETRVLD
ncbi:MAG: RsmD family RNA methyltransferase, partial [Negativicoccus succinicivorans]|nr:RsmD family RNA methyltransferase [Negativicoccus succinicivorans]